MRDEKLANHPGGWHTKYAFGFIISSGFNFTITANHKHAHGKGAPMPSFTLEINGQIHILAAEAEMPLLWALRDLLGLTGTKFSCGAGLW